jgi:hypothetical protein
LKYLQTNTNFDNGDAFCEQLQVAINKMLEDVDSKLFGEYFLKNYSNTYQKWAYYFRQNCGINTNMRLESMHNSYLCIKGVMKAFVARGVTLGHNTVRATNANYARGTYKILCPVEVLNFIII